MASEKSETIATEMVDLSVRAIKYVETLALPRSVANQLIRSVTSIGANFTEAQDASSKKDFVNKIYIAKKEAAETKYWLSIVRKLIGQSDSELEEIYQQTQSFLMMLQKIINTSKEGNRD